MIGGGEGGQIGPAHGFGAGLDGYFGLRRGRARTTGRTRAALTAGGSVLPRTVPTATGAVSARGESGRDEGIDLVTCGDPNATHYEITRALSRSGLSRGFAKRPWTMTVEEGEEYRAELSRETGRICAKLNYGYCSGYSLVRHMRAWVGAGRSRAHPPRGRPEFAHGHHCDAGAMPQPRGALGATEPGAGRRLGEISPIAVFIALHLGKFSFIGQEVRAG